MVQGMKIGISVLSIQGMSHWSNGIRQNAVFLAQLLKCLPFVEKVWMLETGLPEVALGLEHFNKLGLGYATPAEVCDDIDLAIELVGVLPLEWKRLIRARGKKVIYLCCGQPFAALAEALIFKSSPPVIEVREIDQIWVLPKDRSFLPLMRQAHRCPVDVAPYLWSPYFVEDRIAEVSLTGAEFGYRSRQMLSTDTGLRLAILEPNISVLKSCTIPMLACDLAYRQEPRSVEFMNVLCAEHMVKHPTLLHMGNATDLVRDHKAVFLGRFDVVGFMAQHANAIVSHQWQNDQNYSYLDALYGNYPLIHNSPWLWNEFQAGYYYPEFNAIEAGRQIVEAWRHHDTNRTTYHQRSQRLFESVSPLNARNQAQYAQLIQSVMSGQDQLTPHEAST
jgi:Protein of unknown function (DUF2827)